MVRKLSNLLNLNVRRNQQFLLYRTLKSDTNVRKASGVVTGLEEKTFEKGAIQHSPYPAIFAPKTDIFSYTFRNFTKWNSKIHTECGITGRNFTYSQTVDGALRWGAALGRILPHTLNPRIAYICTNSPEYVALFFGTVAAGAVITPINPVFTPQEVAYQLKDSGADMIVVDSFLEPLADGALKYLGKDLPVFITGPGPTKSGRPIAHDILVDRNAPKIDPSKVDPSSTALIPYSSGTTGKPKGVVLTHQAIVNNIAMMMSGNFSPISEAVGNHQEVQIGILPFFHIFGIVTTMLCSTTVGIRTVTLPKFDPSLFIQTVKKNKLTTFQAVPLLMQFISECPMISEKDLSSLHSFVCGAAPLSVEVAKSLKKKAPQAILQEGYGMTESLVTHVTPKFSERIGFCGQLLPNIKAKIVDVFTGDILPPNTPGELYIQTPSMMLGYLNNENATRETIDEEGWLRTGDMAEYTEEGFYLIIDRIKELIKVKGLQVSPSELEEVIGEHPGVSESGVIGVPHPRLGEAPLAFIVKSDPNLSEEVVHSHMSERLSKHKQLAGGIRFVKELPKNQTGKLLRRVLAEMVV